MPARKIPLVTGEHYHIISRATAGAPVFSEVADARTFVDCLKYYSQINPSFKFSYFHKNPNPEDTKYDKLLVTIESYCIMPTHIHFLLKQNEDDGISMYMQRLLVSFSHYFNKKHRRIGQVLISPFKSVHIETEEQFMHVSRYIHLNPSSAGIVEDPLDYPYSSLYQYKSGQASGPVDPTFVLGCFSSKESYLRFVYSRKDYQRKLQYIKTSLLDYDDPGSSLDYSDPGSEIL